MPRLPRITGDAAVRALRCSGWQLERIRGSHHILIHSSRPGATVTVPVHRGEVLKLKTLSSILDQAGMTVDEFIALL